MMLELDKETLTKLRNKLKRGDLTEIARSLDYDLNYVSVVLRGLQHNDKVIDAAIELAQKRKDGKEQATKIINEL